MTLVRLSGRLPNSNSEAAILDRFFLCVKFVFYCCGKQQQLREEQVCFTSMSHTSLSLRRVKVEIQAGAEAAGLVEGSCLPHCFPWLSQPALLCNTGPPPRRQYCPHKAESPLPHKLFIKKMPTDMFTDESNKGSSLNMVLSSHMTLICVKQTNLTSTLSRRRLASNSVIFLCQPPKCWNCK